MKIEIHFGDIKEVLEARDAAESLSRLKAETAARAPLLLRGIIKSLGDIQFAQEAVKRENATSGRSDALPQTAQEFLDWAVERGYATVLDA
jgi:hypothetical protein